MRVPALLLLLLPFLGSCATPGSELSVRRDASPVTLELEGGPVWQGRNVVRIPGDDGTRYSMNDLTGNGPFATTRLTGDWNIDERHALRAVIAPLEFDGTVEIEEDIRFAGKRFDSGERVKGTYKFSSYRLGYRYTFLHDEHWRLRAGGTLFVRDAEIELRQGGKRASDSDVGVVPLLNLAAEFYPAERWRLVGELDGLASSRGRAFDVALKAYYDVSDSWSVGVGYRTIEGGADNDDVFNFAWFHSMVFSVAVRF